MANDTEFHLSNNGHTEVEEETEEQLQVAHKKLTDLVGNGKDGALVTFGKQELSLLQKVLSTGSEKYREEQMWRMCDFIDEDEALDHVAAYYEARDLGMDTSFNVAFAFALSSANRKINRNNLVAQLLDALQHGKWANAPQGKKKDGTNARSPLSNG